jgi:hypothetical protein
MPTTTLNDPNIETKEYVEEDDSSLYCCIRTAMLWGLSKEETLAQSDDLSRVTISSPSPTTTISSSPTFTAAAVTSSSSIPNTSSSSSIGSLFAWS